MVLPMRSARKLSSDLLDIRKKLEFSCIRNDTKTQHVVQGLPKIHVTCSSIFQDRIRKNEFTKSKSATFHNFISPHYCPGSLSRSVLGIVADLLQPDIRSFLDWHWLNCLSCPVLAGLAAELSWE